VAQEIYDVAVASGLVILQNTYTGNPHLSCSQVRELLYNMYIKRLNSAAVDSGQDWTE
jgi:hypothetical protein